MIKFSFSGEIDSKAYDTYRPIRNEVVSLLNEKLGNNDYGSCVNKIFLAPIILEPKIIEGKKERRLFKNKTKVADYRLKIDFSQWQKGNTKDRMNLLICNLLETITDLNRKLKGKFEGESLINDINRLFIYVQQP